MQNDYCDMLPPKTPCVTRKFLKSPSLSRQFRDLSRQSSVCSSSSINLSRLLDPEICDNCTCDTELHDNSDTGDTRFMVSMVTHQLPHLDTCDDHEDLMLASLVAHMVCKLIGDEDQ